ncbi:hypothetical protein EVG20_g3642 [Dentipellis fragilis]|uniref:Uncharacterized protein n=1 Tax=Dentipellis fragilis TaxID=205917 RepID=A0A4Y9Z2N8_9AGAM|nr:hypothetical protein EVG20_g3642 [Dentipellis fragilis]
MTDNRPKTSKPPGPTGFLEEILAAVLPILLFVLESICSSLFQRLNTAVALLELLSSRLFALVSVLLRIPPCGTYGPEDSAILILGVQEGIGRSAALRFSELGYTVFALCPNEYEGELPGSQMSPGGRRHVSSLLYIWHNRKERSRSLPWGLLAPVSIDVWSSSQRQRAVETVQAYCAKYTLRLVALVVSPVPGYNSLSPYMALHRLTARGVDTCTSCSAEEERWRKRILSQVTEPILMAHDYTWLLRQASGRIIVISPCSEDGVWDFGFSIEEARRAVCQHLCDALQPLGIRILKRSQDRGVGCLWMSKTPDDPSKETQGNSVHAAVARTLTRTAALYFSRPVRLFRPSKISGWHSLRGLASHEGASLTPQFLSGLVKAQGLIVIPKHFAPPLLVNAALGTVLWATYAETSSALQPFLGSYPVAVAALSGAAAGGSQALVAAPTENVRLAIEGFAAFFTIFELTRCVAAGLKAATQDLVEPYPLDDDRRHSVRRFAPRIVHGVALVSGGAVAGWTYEVMSRPWDAARRAVYLDRVQSSAASTRTRFSLNVIYDKIREDGFISLFRNPEAAALAHTAAFAAKLYAGFRGKPLAIVVDLIWPNSLTDWTDLAELVLK